MNIGIFGGTFDPWHVGHSAIVKKAFEQLGLDKIIVVPTTVNYYRADKRYLFTYDEKIKIIQDFLVGTPNVEIDTVEKDKNGEWRTIDTLQYFKDKYPNDRLFYIIGEDSYREFQTWTRWEDILKIAHLCVANRGYDQFETNPAVPCLRIDLGDDFEDSSATNVRNKLIEELIDMYLLDKEWYNKVK